MEAANSVAQAGDLSAMNEIREVGTAQLDRNIDASHGPSDTEVEQLLCSLELKKKVLSESKLFIEVMNTVNNTHFDAIRCIALGSPCQERQAFYQLAFLLLLVDHLKVPHERVSLYDPVFSKLDLALFKKLQYTVTEDHEYSRDTEVLHFMPHAPLSLTNYVFETQKPNSVLANNLLTHTERLTKVELYKKYPLLSKVVNIIQTSSTNSKPIQNQFKPVIKKRSRKQKLRYVEPDLDYNAIESYFTAVQLFIFDQVEGPWLNSFTDLAFHSLT